MLPQDTARALANSLGAANDASTPDPKRVYLVATGQAFGAQETYTRHEGRPPLCDAEVLYTTPPLAAKPLTEADLDAAQARAIDALLAIPGWKRDEDWFDRGETHEDDREAINIDTVREIVAAGLEGYRC